MNALYIELADRTYPNFYNNKVFRIVGIAWCDVFCFTLLWKYKERQDVGFGLFRLSIGTFAEYNYERGIIIEMLGLSMKWLKKRKHLNMV